MHALLGSPHVTAAQLAELVTGSRGRELDEHGRNFVSLLAQNRRLGFLPEIAALFEQMKAEVENAVDVEVTSATALDARPGKPLRGRIAEEARAPGAPAHQGRPAACMGGAVLKAGDLVIDGSIKGRLERLAIEMTA